MKNNYSKVFMWMFIGLLVTFATGYFVSTNERISFEVKYISIIYNKYVFLN